MNRLIPLFYPLILSLLISCKTPSKLYTNTNKSGDLSIKHYTSTFPSLDPCGFSRDFDAYSITTPRTDGRIESGELVILKDFSHILNISYVGYIEFINKRTVYINLYKLKNSVKTALSINGSHKIKEMDNEIQK